MQSKYHYTLQEWWADHGDYFCDAKEYGLTDFDDKGQPYDWEDDNKLEQQIPSYHDFIKIFAHEAVRHIFFANNNVDMYIHDKRKLSRKAMRKMWHLHDKLYETDIEHPRCVIGGLELADVHGEAQIKVYGAERSRDA